MTDDEPPADKPTGLDSILASLKPGGDTVAGNPPTTDQPEPELSTEEMIEHDIGYVVEVLEDVVEGTQGSRQFVVVEVDHKANEIGVVSLACCRQCARRMLQRALSFLDEEERDERRQKASGIVPPDPATRH